MIFIDIIEDDPVVREALKDFFDSREDIHCSAAKESVEAYLATLKVENVPDVILMDIGLPGMSGISGVKILKSRYPEINIIMQTVYHDSQKIFQSLCAGASGYLLKNMPFKEIENAVRTVYEGGSFMSPQIARKVMDFFYKGKNVAASKQSPLSGKETEVVHALVDGLSYKDIADKSFISVETVRSHIKNIYKKLHVHSKAEVIRKSLNGEI
ncbi:MAG TPA: DNA-binding response regulator [Cytophagales bacterium]|jgi:DNA-binding NarL/FixJ family response regulator|nr:DNA-binding response regulator [Cytophagales bacterium]